MNSIDLLPSYRSGTVVEQQSGYDRTGGNDDGFSGKYSYIRIENNKLVLADLKGPGIINRIWTATPTNDSISFYFDGENTPRLALRFNELFTDKRFPFNSPVAGNAIGGNYSYLPIPYSKSCKILFHGPKIEFIQIQYRSLPGQQVETYTDTFSEAERSDLLQVRGLWANTFPSVTNFTKGRSSGITTSNVSYILKPGEEFTFFSSNSGGRIAGFEVDAGTAFEGNSKDILLSARWDNEEVEAIYAPVADFFGYAYGKGSMRNILIGKYSYRNYCYFPMPFDTTAELKLIYKIREESNQPEVPVTVKVYHNNEARNSNEEGKFYSCWRREINPPIGRYYDFLNVTGKGHYIGTMHLAQGLRPGITLFFEGDDISYTDGKLTIHGTGSEDYYNGGWYNIAGKWDRAFSMAVHGSLDYNASLHRTGGYRFFISDKMSFETGFYHAIEHGPEGNEFPVDYTSVAYYYCSQPPSGKMEPTLYLRENPFTGDAFLQDDFREPDNTIRPQHGDISIVDIDDDQDLDIIVSGIQRSAPNAVQSRIFINDGKGNFTSLPSSVTPGFLASIDAGDIDGDGDADLIFNGALATGSSWTRGIALNNGKGHFELAPADNYPTPAGNGTSCFFGDFNNDGLLDYGHAGNYTGPFAVLYVQQEDGTFREDHSSFEGFSLMQPLLVPVDINNDSYTDLFVMGRLLQARDEWKAGPITGYFKNNGYGQFSYVNLISVKPKFFGSADWSDLDGNGWLDLLIHGEGTGSSEPNEWTHRIYSNDNGTFEEAFFYQRSRQFSSGGASILQDIDNDGDADMLFGGYSDQLIPNRRQKTYVYLNNNENEKLNYEDFNENYFLSNRYLPGMSEQDVEIADLDGDYRPDFFYMGFNENYADNPVQANRVIAGWSPSPSHNGLFMHPFRQQDAPENLKTVQLNNGRIKLSWDKPAYSTAKGLTYNLALYNLSTGKWMYNPLAVTEESNNGWRKTNRPGNLFLNTSVELQLPKGEYEWTVQAIDPARFGGKFADSQTITVTTRAENTNIQNLKFVTGQGKLSILNNDTEPYKLKLYTSTGVLRCVETVTTSFSIKLKNGIYIAELISKSGSSKHKILIR